MVSKLFPKMQGNEYFIHQNCMPDQCSAPKYLTLHNHFPYLLQSLFYNFCMLYHSPILGAFLLNLKALLGRDLVFFFYIFTCLVCVVLPSPPDCLKSQGC